MYRLAIFDMDGTILNTIDDLTDASNFLCRKYNFPEHTVEEFKFFVGNGIPKMIRRALPENISEDLYNQILKEYVEEHYSNYERSISASVGLTEMNYQEEDGILILNRFLGEIPLGKKP